MAEITETANEYEATPNDVVILEEADVVIIRIEDPSDDVDLNKRLMITLAKDILGG